MQSAGLLLTSQRCSRSDKAGHQGSCSPFLSYFPRWVPGAFPLALPSPLEPPSPSLGTRSRLASLPVLEGCCLLKNTSRGFKMKMEKGW